LLHSGAKPAKKTTADPRGDQTLNDQLKWQVLGTTEVWTQQQTAKKN
jgi:hypothetical protein